MKIKFADDHLRIALRHCPECGYKLDSVSQLGATTTKQPDPGDDTVCFGCAAWLRFADDLSLRRLTAEEVAELEFGERQILGLASAAVRQIRGVK
jgi:hypothetical protein